MAIMGNGRQLLIRKGADCFRGLVPVHHRHLDIHQHAVVIPGADAATLSRAILPSSAVSTLKPSSIKIIWAISRLIALSSTSRMRIPANPESVSAAPLSWISPSSGSSSARGKARWITNSVPFFLLRNHVNLAAHQVHDAFGDGHAQTRTLNAVHPPPCVPG